MDRLTSVAARRYEQRLRAESAANTRRRVLDAVYERLREAPAEAVSVDRVAKMAGVARSTVYLIFESRAGLFDALTADLYERSGYAGLLEAVRVEDAWEAASGGIRAGVEIFAADRDVFRALHSMEELDREAVGGTIRRIEERRAEGMAWAARRLREQGYLRPGVSANEAAHILWIQASFDAFDLLYTGRGLPAKKVAELLVAIAARSLLAEPRP
jgi:AcrR family transcriptional regulator